MGVRFFASAQVRKARTAICFDQSLLICSVNVSVFVMNVAKVKILSIWPLFHLSSYIPSKKVLTDEVSPDLLVGASLGWGMTITTNDQLVDTLQESGLVKNERVAAAMRAMDRAWFAPQEERGKSSAPLPGEGCYALNKPTKLGFGATMTSPQIQAELLEVRCWPLLFLVIYVVIVAASPSPMHTHYLPIHRVHQVETPTHVT